jgi:hypothetical protein
MIYLLTICFLDVGRKCMQNLIKISRKVTFVTKLPPLFLIFDFSPSNRMMKEEQVKCASVRRMDGRQVMAKAPMAFDQVS